jgi:hypothetical protein
MNIKIDKFTNRYDENALFSHLNSSSLFFFVLLSYYNLSRCSLMIKTLSDCLIQATYYNASTHRHIYHKVLSPIILSTQEYEMRSNYSVRLVKVVMPFPRIIAKGVKYIMLATMTTCLVYLALWFHQYEPMLS